MTVTAITKTKRGRFSVFVDGEFYCVLHAEVFALSSIQTGGEIEPDYLDELLRRSEGRITRERALRLISARSYTEKGLYDKLRDKADEQSAAAAVARMLELGLLDDADYARRFAADCRNLKGYSIERTARELARKGISRDIIDDTIEAMDDDPLPVIARIIRKKYMRLLEDEKGRNKAVNALVRLGYRYGDIRRVIENLLEDEDYYEGEY